MTDVKRFDLGTDNTHYYGVPVIEECEDGDYVLSADYDALKAERDQLRAELAALKAKAAVPDGWRIAAVNDAFSDLMYYLDRASVKGYLDRLYDLVEPWEAFDYEYLDNPSTPEQE